MTSEALFFCRQTDKKPPMLVRQEIERVLLSCVYNVHRMVSERTVGGLCCLRLRQGGVWPTAKFDRSAISFSLVQFSTLYPWVLPWHQRSREFRLELPWSLSDLNPDGKSSCVLMGKEMDVNSQLFDYHSSVSHEWMVMKKEIMVLDSPCPVDLICQIETRRVACL